MATHHYQQTYDTEQARHALEHVHKRSVGLEHAQCGLSLVEDDGDARYDHSTNLTMEDFLLIWPQHLPYPTFHHLTRRHGGVATLPASRGSSVEGLRSCDDLYGGDAG